MWPQKHSLRKLLLEALQPKQRKEQWERRGEVGHLRSPISQAVKGLRDSSGASIPRAVCPGGPKESEGA